MKINLDKKYYSIALVAVIVVLAIIALVNQNKLIKHAKQTAVSSVQYNFGSSKGMAYLYPTSAISNSKINTASCGSDIGGEIAIGNYQLLLVKNLPLGLHRTYAYDLNALTFTPGQQRLWNGQLRTLSVDLSNHNSESVILYQYQDCDHAVAHIFNVNAKTGKLEALNFENLDEQKNNFVITRQVEQIATIAKDKIDTFVGTSFVGSALAVIHWQFDANSNFFKETGKELKSSK